ncbi:hypothetical protein AJ78_07548 [Emergomyces pasteurianus Ep9510]|uniref:glucan endo-1,3-beta-D-glucosidase n=1 Tax=Emergomyces pasteurianus Ep9510 TaxID=1447872 RepID=A0A1J9PV43_9EURO|nr:hypothetical protein AJ78_07548 [Emergomyces pasteurianus Ep9510]
MTLSTPPWLIAMLIIAIGHLPGAHTLPCLPNRNCLGDERDVADNLCFSPVTQFPTVTTQPKPIAALGTYYTALERDVRPTIQPFPTEIFYITFNLEVGLVHPSSPHLDIGPSEAIESDFRCLYRGKPCAGFPHVVKSSTPSWPLPQNTSSAEAIIHIGTTSSIQTPKPSGCPPPYLTDTSISSFPEQTTTSSSISTTSSITTSSSSSTSTASPVAPLPPMFGQNIFEPVSLEPPPANIPRRGDHPLKKEHISEAPGPISTNKFYGNLYLGSQANYAFVQPYGVSWAKGGGVSRSYGLSVSHIESSQLAFGPENTAIPGNPVQFYINPIGIQSMVLSAVELSSSTVLTVSKPMAFSADIVLRPTPNSGSSITFPLVQGMGYVTGVYSGLQPSIQTGVFFRKLESAAPPKPGVFKYRLLLEDNSNWLLYVTPGNGADPNLQLVSNSFIRGPAGFSGTIQVAKNPSGRNGEAIYDRSAGVYATGCSVAGTVDGTTGVYSLTWDKAGKDVPNTPLLMFALPHHVQSFDAETQRSKTDLLLRTTTKGMAMAIAANSWTMNERDLPINIGFAPWAPGIEPSAALSSSAKQTIRDVAPSELTQNIHQQTNLNSMYFSGKALAKFAMLVFTVHELAGDPALAESAFRTLKDAFATFVQNRQVFPLVYDTVWNGVVSSGTYQTGDPGLDFGNTFYNDHHFHYGYFILAAAIIGSIDPSWLDANKAWVNMLVRDAGNSASNDPYFPFSRGFDWYNGHSWAKGLFESGDGKDQESTSEDTMFAFAIKMWGKTINNRSMEARGNLMLGILARSLNSYFLMKSDNTNQPANFIGNKVTGILFENKADHTTYFGTNLEYIQGIHMLPIIPPSAFIRRRDFVEEEWNAMFKEGASTPASRVQGGWQGILYANLAIINPGAAWDFFSSEPFDLAKIDGGASRTWYLAYCACRFQLSFLLE